MSALGVCLCIVAVTLIFAVIYSAAEIRNVFDEEKALESEENQ